MENGDILGRGLKDLVGGTQRMKSIHSQRTRQNERLEWRAGGKTGCLGCNDEKGEIHREIQDELFMLVDNLVMFQVTITAGLAVLVRGT